MAKVLLLLLNEHFKSKAGQGVNVFFWPNPGKRLLPVYFKFPLAPAARGMGSRGAVNTRHSHSWINNPGNIAETCFKGRPAGKLSDAGFYPGFLGWA